MTRISDIGRRRKECTAYHEAGHAVIAIFDEIAIKSVSILPAKDGSMGRVVRGRTPRWFSEYSDDTRQLDHAVKRVKISLAGAIAQRRFQGHGRGLGNNSDDYIAAHILLGFCGSGRSASACLKWIHMLAERAVIVRWPFIQAVAQALLARETLTEKEVRQVIADVPNEVLGEYARALIAKEDAEDAEDAEKRIQEAGI